MPTPDSIGPYSVIRLLGTGGFALVWLCCDDRLDDLVAIKVLAENWSERMDVRARFEQEAKVLRRAKSHRVVQVYQIDEMPDGRPYFVMTYADQGSLADALRIERLPVRQALWYGAEIAAGIHDLHEAGVLHRDVKPSNVLLRSAADGSTQVLIADLGLARDLDRGSRFTLAAGTAGYMAPEQADPGRKIGPPADIYGIGATIYFALTGRAPAGLVPPSSLRAGLPGDVDDVLLRALDPEPERRWPTAEAFREVLVSLSEATGPDSEVTEIGPGAVTAEVATMQHVQDPFAGKQIVLEEPEPEPEPEPHRSRWRKVAALAAAVVIATGAVLYIRSAGQASNASLAAAATSTRPSPPTTVQAPPSTSSISAVPSTAQATVAVSGTAPSPAPVTSAPPANAPGKPLPGQLIRCAVIDGRDYFECFVFSRGNTGYALDFYSDSYHVVMWEKKPPGDPFAWSQHWQFWWIEAKSAYMLYNPASARCLTIDGDGAVGSQLHATPCDPNSPHQLWNWTDTTSWILRNRLGNCLDVPRGEYHDGAAPFGYTCSGNDNQRWLLRPI